MRYILLALSLVAMAGLIGLSSCGKDDPVMPRASVSFERSSRSFDERAGIVEVYVILDRVAGEDITVNYKVAGTAREGAAATAGTDYEISSGPGQVKIKKGQANGVIELNIKDDNSVEGNETIEIEISSATPNVDVSVDKKLTITIDDNDAESEVSFSLHESSLDEDGGFVAVDIVLQVAAPENIVVGYTVSGTAAAGTDYSIDNTGEVQIKKGQTKSTIRIDVKNDVVYEGNETVKLLIDEVSLEGVVAGDNDEFILTIVEDDEPTIASMDVATWTVEESDGFIELGFELNVAAPQDIRIKYALSGSAVDHVTAGNFEIAYDYIVRSTSTGEPVTPGELMIPAGENYGTIGIQLVSDYYLEDGNPATAAIDPETIIISLKESTDYRLGTLKQTTISVKQEDGKAIALLWDENANVDMDLVLWTVDPEVQPIAASNYASVDGAEMLFMPQAIIESVTDAVVFGLSYVYFSGAVEPLDFQVQFIDVKNQALEAQGTRDIYNAQYKLDNINDSGKFEDMQIEQRFSVLNGNYNWFFQIQIPDEGSRMRGIKDSVPSYLGKRKVQTVPRAARP